MLDFRKQIAINWNFASHKSVLSEKMVHVTLPSVVGVGRSLPSVLGSENWTDKFTFVILDKID